MKKLCLFFLLFVLSLASFSQTQLGIKAGLNINDIDDDAALNHTATRIGFHGGLLAHIRVLPKMAIQPEAVVSLQGAEYTTPNSRGYNGKLDLTYLNIPVLFQYLAKRGFRLETGPQLGILLDGKLKRNNGTVNDLKATMNEADFSWAFGIGYLSRTGLGVDARYNLGLTNVLERGTPDSKNRVWQIGLFYQFLP